MIKEDIEKFSAQKKAAELAGVSLEEAGVMTLQSDIGQVVMFDPVVLVNTVQVNYVAGEHFKGFFHATEGSAGYDVAASQQHVILPGAICKVHTDVRIAVPRTHVALLYPRSGLASKGIMLANSVGVIDSDYLGEVLVALYNATEHIYTIRAGDRIAQLVITERWQVEFNEVQQLEATNRGEGGFGHSGN